MKFLLLPALLFLGLVALPGPALAESGNYRIEVLVFNHINNDAEPHEVDELRSFSQYPELTESLPANAPMKIDAMSDLMQANWRRLRLSADFHPIVFASWEQSRIDYHPQVRIHDEDLIAEQLNFPHQVAFVDLREMDLFEDYMDPYYRLDGTVQLQRTRFLHLNLDLEYRQDLLPRPVTDHTGLDLQLNNIVTGMAGGEAIPEQGPNMDVNSDLISDLIDPSPGPALIHSIKQSRQIRTGQMQYFDTPYLGVLIRVTSTSGQ